MKSIWFLGLVLASGSTAMAETSEKSCARVSVAKGDSCQNLKVSFNFRGCGKIEPARLADKVDCAGDSATAFATVDGVVHRANFRLKQEGWGAASWSPSGGVKMAAVPVQPPAEARTAPVAESNREPAETVAAVIEAAKDLKSSAYFDFRMTTYNSENPAVNERDFSGFLLEEGAFYLNYASGRLAVLVDLPFARDLNTGNGQADVLFMQKRAQLQGRFTVAEGLTFGFGQFDTFYGVELNDSKDRVFGNAGLVYNNTLPVVHQGAYVEYAASGFTGRLMIANPSDRESLSATAGDNYFEGGVTLGYAAGPFRSQVGHLSRPKKNLAGASGTRSLTDFIVGATVGPIDIDVEYAIVDDPQKDKLTALATDEEDAGTGLLVLAAYRVTDDLKLGVRYENIDKSPAASTLVRASAWAGNATYKIHEQVAVRAEWYDVRSEQRTSADEYSSSRFDLAALVNF